MLAKKHTVDIWRKEAVGTNGRKQHQLNQRFVGCLLVPMSTATAIQNDFSPSKGWEGFFDEEEDLKVGDRLKGHGKTFEVRFIRPFTGLGPASHLHAMCEETT